MNLHGLLFPRKEQKIVALEQLLEMALFDRVAKRDKAVELKQLDCESWATGELMERACIFAHIFYGPENSVSVPTEPKKL